MPHNNSAKKRLRKSETNRIANKTRITELKTIRKKLERAVHDGKKEEADDLYRTFTKRIDQAASRNTVHKKAAARTKSRMAIAVAKGAPPKQTAAPTKAEVAKAAKAKAKTVAPKA